MNKVILMGNLTKDFEANEALTVARSSMALNRGKDKDGNDKGADFPSIVAFGNSVKALVEYGKKGRRFLVEGHIQTGSYERNGSKVYTTDVVIDKWEFGDSRANNAQPSLGVAPEISDSEFMHIPDGIEEELPFN